jgi:hypothetical protein
LASFFEAFWLESRAIAGVWKLGFQKNSLCAEPVKADANQVVDSARPAQPFDRLKACPGMLEAGGERE